MATEIAPQRPHRLSTLEALLSVIGEDSADGILVIDPSGHIVWTNKVFRQLWRIADASEPSRLDALIDKIRQELHAPDAISAEDWHAPSAASHQPLRRKDGIRVEHRRIPLKDELGVVHRFREMAKSQPDMDWSAAIDAERQRFSRMVAAVPGMLYQFILRADQTSAFLFVSEGCRDLYGLTPEEILADGGSILNIVHPDDAPAFAASIGVSAAKLSRWHWEGRVILRDGQLKWIAGISTPTRLPNGDTVWFGQLMDVTARKVMEQEASRVEMQEKLLAAQSDALLRLSTPLIPIRDDIMVMPIVGLVDQKRAERILETMLEGVAKSRARILILDITGVSEVDADIAAAILRAAEAVKLLGAQVVLTGIRAEVAQMLIGLGVDLSRLTTRSTLQAGVAFAVGRRGFA